MGHLPINKKNLTLVELLIVVAVLAILMSLLGPSLKSALGQARTIQCTQNLKIMYLSTIGYSEDYSGVIPPANTSETGDFVAKRHGGPYGDYGTFMSFIQSYRVDLPISSWNGSGGIKEPEYFICPSDEATGIKYGKTIENLRRADKRWTTYSHVRNVWNYIDDRLERYPNPINPKNPIGTQHTLPLLELTNPRETHMIVDGTNGHGHVNEPWATPGIVVNEINQRVVARDQGKGLKVTIRIDHNNGYNSLMFDGSIQHHSFPAFPECMKISWLKKH